MMVAGGEGGEGGGDRTGHGCKSDVWAFEHQKYKRTNNKPEEREAADEGRTKGGKEGRRG